MNRFHRSRHCALLASVAALMLTLNACGDPRVNLSMISPEEKFRLAMIDFENDDFKEAQEKFTAIIIQDPTSPWADDAQFYLGEAHFRNDEYLLAAFQYNRLRSNFPNSPFYRQALFRTAEAYEKSSPNLERDQTDTRTAIAQYEAFVRLYPGDSLAPSAREHITVLRTKLANKEFSIAEQYWRMDEYHSALIYYDRVIELYPDTPYHERSIIGRIRALQQLERDQEARDAIDRYIQENPNSSTSPQLRQLKSDLGRP